MRREVSLYEYLHVKKLKLTHEQKLDVVKELCRTLSTLHAMNPPIYHNHLHSRNIFISFAQEGEEFKVNDSGDLWVKVKIGDLGDTELRKYTKIFGKHEVRNAWSPPEVLLNPDITFSEDSGAKIDIYSFGMITWEIFSSGMC